MGLMPDTSNCMLCMRRECRERFPHHRLQRNPLISDPGMHRGTCVTHVPWCMSGSPGGENLPGTPGTCTTGNFTYLTRDPCSSVLKEAIGFSSATPLELSLQNKTLKRTLNRTTEIGIRYTCILRHLRIITFKNFSKDSSFDYLIRCFMNGNS